MSKTINEIPNTAELFKYGFGGEFAVALLNSVEMYITAFEKDGCVMGECNIRDLQNLILLYKAVVKDVTSIDFNDPESFNL